MQAALHVSDNFLELASTDPSNSDIIRPNEKTMILVLVAG